MRRVPLHDIEAERALIGAAIIDPLLVERLAHLQAADFYRTEHAEIWAAMQALSGQVWDTVALRAELTRRGAGEGTLRALREAEEAAISAAHAEQHAEVILERATRRRMVEAAERIRGLAQLPGDVRDLVDRAEAAMTVVADRRRAREPIGSPQAMVRALRWIQAQREDGGRTGVTWGLPTLDHRTTGMQPGELWVLAARPGMGKSALAMDVAIAAAREGTSVLICSLEMQIEQLGTRALCAMARIPIERARGGSLSHADMEGLQKAVHEAAALPIWWYDDPDATILDIRAVARRLRQRDPRLGLVIVDYLQLVETAGEQQPEARHLEVAQISRGLKKLAGELALPVLALSQLSREVEKGKRPPQLSDLRESGAIEQDADGVVFIHREGEAEPEGPRGEIPCWAIVAKARNGPTGWVPLRFLARLTTFEEGDHCPEPPAPDAPVVVDFTKQRPRRSR